MSEILIDLLTCIVRIYALNVFIYLFVYLFKMIKCVIAD